MPCTCSMTDSERRGTAAATAVPHTSLSTDAVEEPLCSFAGTTSTTATCYHCLCTVCGRDLAGIPTVTCAACGSQTHITCARDAYSHEWLFAEVTGATPSAAATAASASTAPRKGMPAMSAAVPARASHQDYYTLAPDSTLCDGPVGATAGAGASYTMASSSALSLSPPLSRDASHTSLLPSSQALRTAAAKIDKEYRYFCHPDCAMGMQVMRNPQFNAALSQRVETAFERDWAHLRAILTSRLGSNTGAEAPEQASTFSHVDCEPSAGAPPAGPSTNNGCHSSLFDELHRRARANDTLTGELMRLYSQLRAEAWAEYFEQERHHSGHPLFYPPPFVDVVREAALSHVLEAASPHGQAARLYLLHPDTHPVGSAVAIPVGVLTRWQQPGTTPLFKVNETNSFMAESLEAIVGGAVEPETTVVYRNCNKKGRTRT